MPMSTSRGFRQRDGVARRTLGLGGAASVMARLPALLAMSLGLLFATSVHAKTLKIATLMPEGSGFVSEMRQAGNKIQERTEGRVKLKFYPGGVMGNDKTVMRKMRIGQLHGAALPSGPLARVYPDIELYSLPLLFRDYAEVEYVRERLDEQLKAGLAKAGFTALSISDGGFAYLLSQTTIRRVEDLAKTKVWIPEGDIMSQTALEIAGVSPIPLPTADVYTALQTGLIDTVAAPPMGAIAFQWHTKVRTMTNVPLMYLIGIFTIDSKTFSKLRPEDQVVVREEIANASERLDAETRLGDAGAMEALRNQGIEMVMASSPAEVERWHDISVRATERLRGLNRYSESLLDQIIEYLETYRAQLPLASPDANSRAVPATASIEPK
jgi:TRAP-type C4-dicarboxylate transport system substrate-binding protein